MGPVVRIHSSAVWVDPTVVKGRSSVLRRAARVACAAAIAAALAAALGGASVASAQPSDSPAVWTVQEFTVPTVDASGAPDAAAAAADQWRPDIFGSWIVWQDERNAALSKADIYGFRFTPAGQPVNLLLSREAGMGSLAEADTDSWPSLTEQWVVWTTGNLGEEPTSVRALDLSRDLTNPANLAPTLLTEPSWYGYWPVAFGERALFMANSTFPAWQPGVFVWDFSTGTRSQPSTTTSALPGPLAGYGDLIVWTDSRGADVDLYGMYLSDGVEFPICTASGNQESPTVYGNTVVWADFRVASDADIFGATVSKASHTATEFQVTSLPTNEMEPTIGGDIEDVGGVPTAVADLVVWVDTRATGTSGAHLFAKSLKTGVEFPVSTMAGGQSDPEMEGRMLVWQQWNLQNDSGDVHGARIYHWDGSATLATKSGSLWTRRTALTLACAASLTEGSVTDMRLSTGDDVVLWGGPWENLQSYQSFPVVTLPSGDGVKQVSAQYFGDLAGGDRTYSPVRTISVTLDTKRPVPKAPRSASVRRGAYVKLAYRANDALSPKARVTIKVKTLGGKTLKTMTVRSAVTNTSLTKRFRCALPKGSYRFWVYARDLAGNTQAKAASNRLTVR